MPLTIVAQMKAHDGKADALRQALVALIRPTLSEDGCEAYELHRSLEDPNLFHFNEIWATRDDWERHRDSVHIKAFRQMAATLVAEGNVFQLERIA